MATIEGYPRLEGRMMNMLLAPRREYAAGGAQGKERKAGQAGREAGKAGGAGSAEGGSCSRRRKRRKRRPPRAPAEPPRPAPAKEDYGIGTQAEDTEDGGEAG